MPSSVASATAFEFEMIPTDRVASVIDEIEHISNDWLVRCAGEQEKGFSVAAFHRDYVLSQPVALLRQNGEAVAFATVMTTDLSEEVTVGLMRHKPGAASRYAMEYLFIRLIQCCREQGYRSFCLGMVPLSGLRAHRLAPHWHRVARIVWSLGRRFYNFQGLRTFKGKFDPIWEPRYLAASGWFGPYLALIDIVALRVSIQGVRLGVAAEQSDDDLRPARTRGRCLMCGAGASELKRPNGRSLVAREEFGSD